MAETKERSVRDGWEGEFAIPECDESLSLRTLDQHISSVFAIKTGRLSFDPGASWHTSSAQVLDVPLNGVRYIGYIDVQSPTTSESNITLLARLLLTMEASFLLSISCFNLDQPHPCS